MNKYRIKLTRLVEEECCLYVDAGKNEDVHDKAIEAVEDSADAIWVRSDCEPHTYTVEEIKPADPQEW